MSRSKHTRPARILAAKRVLAPYESRGSDDRSAFRQLSRDLKEEGIVLDLVSNEKTVQPIMPRFVVKRPREGFIHTASKADLVNMLHFFGAVCFYGLRSIKLIQGSGTANEVSLPFGRLVVPGTIILYDQPTPPWFINGSIPHVDKVRLERAGALIESADNDTHRLIRWTNNDLRDFMIFEVFMHEIGHHIIQQYKGKRNNRVMRTKDHERFADAFSKRCRQSYLAYSMGNNNA